MRTGSNPSPFFDRDQWHESFPHYAGAMIPASCRFALGAVLLALSTAAHASEAEPAPVTPYADLRFRLEVVDQAGLPQDATASTFRIRAGLKTAPWQGFSALVEGEAIMRFGPEHYNDTVNGRTTYPVVADPADVLLNQAHITWRPSATIAATAGRQAVNLDNQRWIGSVGWRQNDQTLDAARVSLTPAKGASADYLYAWRVNRVFGPDSPQGIWRDTDIHGLRASLKAGPVGTVTAYGYFLDIPAQPGASSRTVGVRLQGEQAIGAKTGLLYAAEYARQSDLAGNPADYALDYLLLEPGISAAGFTIRGGFEQLEGNGLAAVQTPLATLHAFNGWADKFLVTPANGLRDLYLDAGYRFADASPLKGLTLRALWHDFDATRGGASYGRELDLLASYPLRKNVIALVKFAHYDADAFATDTTKGWVSIEARF